MSPRVSPCCPFFSTRSRGETHDNKSKSKRFDVNVDIRVILAHPVFVLHHKREIRLEKASLSCSREFKNVAKFEEQSRQSWRGSGCRRLEEEEEEEEAPACREESAVENDRSEGALTLIAGNTWWNTRGSRSGTVGTKRPPRDLSLIEEVHVPPLIGRRRARPRHSLRPRSIYDPRRASCSTPTPLSSSCHPSIPALIGRQIGQGSGKPIRKRWI